MMILKADDDFGDAKVSYLYYDIGVYIRMRVALVLFLQAVRQSPLNSFTLPAEIYSFLSW
jgi:hypothetical protein